MSNNPFRSYNHAADTTSRRIASRKQPDNFSRKSAGPPSYAAIDRQTGVKDIDMDGKTLVDEEEKLADDAKQDVIDAKSFKAPTKSGKAPTAQAVAPEAHQQASLKEVNSKCWTIVSTINIPLVQYTRRSSYIPCAISLFMVLYHIEQIIDGNEELRWLSLNYFSLPARVYYSVMFHVQILRAKEAANTITKKESSWLRAFFRRFKEPQLIIAGPLVPIFSNITAVLPDDDQFAFIAPTLPDSAGTYSVSQTEATPPVRTLTVSPLHYLLPSVPLVASILRKFCTDENVVMDAQGCYVPFTGEEAATIAGVSVPAKTGGTFDAATIKLMCNPAIANPIVESEARLREIKPFWRRSACHDIPAISTERAYSPSGISDLTLLGENFDWFEPCIAMALIQTKFLENSTNITNIPVIGGSAATIVADLKFGDALGPPATLSHWYPECFKSAKAKFTSTAATCDVADGFAAAYALTNAKLNWTDATNNPVGGNAATYRNGPFWENTKTNYSLEHYDHVLSGLHPMLQTHFFDAHANARPE